MKVTFDQCDSVEEVCGLFNRVFANQDQMEAKIVQNAQEIEALKPKKMKKGSKMKKGFATKQVVAILMVLAAIVSVCFAAYVPGDINYDIASNPETLSIYLRDVTNNMRSFSYVFTPRAAAPTPAAEGMVYYNDGTNKWVGYNGAAWLDFDVAGGVTLNGAYDSGGAGLGRQIDVTDSTVLFAATNVADNIAFTVTQADNNGNTQAMQITHAGAGATYISLDIDSQATGRDVEGTGATWYVTGAGAHTAASADFTGAAGITLQNDETITNAADGKITFTTNGGTANTLLFDLQAGATAIQFESGDVTELQFGTVDNLTEIGNITFDADPAAITLTGDGGGDDLTITQAGAVDASVVVHSAGTNLDAIKIHTDGDGGIDIDADEDIAITVTSDAAAEDLLITQSGAQNAGIVLTSDGTGAIAIKLETTSATGDIWLDSGDDLDIDVAGKIDIDLVGDYELDVAAGINITSSEAADGAITIATSDAAGNIIITSTDATADALDINTTAGGIDIDSASTITIDNAAGDITIDSAAGSLNLTGAEAAADAVTITSGGGIDIAAVDDVDFILTADGAGEDFTIQCTGAFDTTLSLLSSGTAANAIEIITTAGGIDITNVGSVATEDLDISSNRAVNITSSEATDLAILIQTSHADGNIRIQSADDTADAIDINATAGGLDVDVALQLSLVSAEGSADSVQITSTGGGIDILCDTTDAGGEDLDIGLTGATDSSIDINSSGTGVDAIILACAAGGIDIDAGTDTIHIQNAADGANDDITIRMTGAHDTSIILENVGGTGADAISLQATGGSIDIDAEASSDITFNGGQFLFTSEHNVANAFNITANTGNAETITLINTQGITVSLAEAETAAIQLYADAGGIGLNSGLNGANAIRIEADGGGNEIIIIHSNQGTGASAATEVDASIQLLSDVGGICLQSNLNGADAIRLETQVGANSILILHSNAGTGASAATEVDASIQLLSDVGGIGLQSGLNGADAIRLETRGGAGAILMLHSNDGTGVAATGEVDSSIQLMSDDGGIGLYTTANLANAVRIETNGGGNETIVINSVQGTGAASIGLNSVLGGVTVAANAAGKDITISSVLGSIAIKAEEDGAAAAISIVADGNAGTGILIHADTGTSVTENTGALQLLADEGAVIIQSDANLDNALQIRVDGGTTSEMEIHNDRGTTSDSIHIISDDGGITIAGGADDNITLTTGAAGGAAGNVVFTNGQTRKVMFLPKAVELDGTNPPALSDIGTDAQTNISALQFDADPDTTGDDMCYISWMVPDGYIIDSARLNIGYSFSTAEAETDECQFDFTINAVAPGELLDQAGTALDNQTTVITHAGTDNGKLHVTQYNIDGTAEVFAVDDLVTIKILVDEDDCLMNASGTLDVLYFEIEWESTE